MNCQGHYLVYVPESPSSSWASLQRLRFIYYTVGIYDSQFQFTSFSVFFNSIHLSHSFVSDSETSWTAACQASLSITNSRSLLKVMSIELVMPSNHLILYCPPFLPPSIFPSVRVFASESVLLIRGPKYWSFSFSISLSNEYSGLISFRIDNVFAF